jgi:hypothetical protein
MTRISSLLFATSLAILPIGAFAQATPPNTPTQPPSASAAPMKTDAKTPTASKKTDASMKDTKSSHAGLGSKTPPAPSKTAEPGKS